MNVTTPQPQVTVAGAFHAGSICPSCQEAISTGQTIVTCPQCTSVHHETCWLHKGGCSSYHCDKAVRGNAAALPAEIAITAAELQNVVVPPPSPRRAAQEVAAAYLPKKPQRVSRMALLSLGLAGLSSFGVAGAIFGSTAVIGIGIALAMAALVCGILAMVFINNTENRISGMPLASGGVISTLGLLIVLSVLMSYSVHKHSAQQQIDMKLSENLPSEEQLAVMNAPLRNAMRANVVIKTGGGFGGIRYGSGVISKLAQNKAYIVTNKHVLGDQKKDIDVLFYNGERSSGSVEWLAPGEVDIAVIGCHVLSLDKYAELEVAGDHVGAGEKVFAVGNPMGLAWSYAEGTISSLRNSEMGSGTELYQTQTPINSGNSGGGLYTLSGVLVGINTLTHDKATSEGLSFAITSASIVKLFTGDEKERWVGKIRDSAEKTK